MNVFVYEYITALAGIDGSSSIPASLRAEGQAMLDAVQADFAALPNCTVITNRDSADVTLIIAPETEAVLERGIARSRGPVLNASLKSIALTGDKLRLAEWWQRHGVPTPRTVPVRDSHELTFPQVWKLRDGAGSQEMRLVERPEPAIDERFIAQEFVAGRAASVAFLVGADRTVSLIPAWQHLSDDGVFRYLGGELPIPQEFAERAIVIAKRAIECVPGLLGYVGVDVILSDVGDFVIEINPRLTTSYIGLRQIADFNLAEAMLACIGLAQWPEIRWREGVVRFGV